MKGNFKSYQTIHFPWNDITVMLKLGDGMEGIIGTTSQVERILIGREDMGFVRFVGKNAFVLDPSPFTRREGRILICEIPPLPPEGSLIRVETAGSRFPYPLMEGGSIRWVYASKVEHWSPMSIEEIYRPSRRTRELFISDLEIHLWASLGKGLDNPLARAYASLLMSAPPIVDDKGGFRILVLGKSTALRAYRYFLSVLPPEVAPGGNRKVAFSVSSSKGFPPLGSEEENHHKLFSEFPNFKGYHLPLKIEEGEIRNRGADSRGLRGFFVDSWLMQPEIDNVAGRIAKRLNDILQDLRKEIHYIEPLSAAFKLSSALARLEGLWEVENSMVDESVSILVDMIEDAAREYPILTKAPRYYRVVSQSARRVYRMLIDMGASENPVDYDEALLKSEMDPDVFWNCIQELRDRNILIMIVRDGKKKLMCLIKHF